MFPLRRLVFRQADIFQRIAGNPQTGVEHLAYDVVGTSLIQAEHMRPVVGAHNDMQILALASGIMDKLGCRRSVVQADDQNTGIRQPCGIQQFGPCRIADIALEPEPPQ